jgi:hypothetical protein
MDFEYFGSMRKKRDGTIEMHGVGELYFHREVLSISGTKRLVKHTTYKGNFVDNQMHGPFRVFVTTFNHTGSHPPFYPDAIAELQFRFGEPQLSECRPFSQVRIEDFPVQTEWGRLKFTDFTPPTRDGAARNVPRELTEAAIEAAQHATADPLPGAHDLQTSDVSASSGPCHEDSGGETPRKLRFATRGSPLKRDGAPDLAKLSVKELKAALADVGVTDTRGCTEKHDLVELLRAARGTGGNAS